MISSEQLANGFGLNVRLIHRHAKGLSHEDTLVQTPYNINCMNWVLGHIARNRDIVLLTLGVTPMLGEEERARYQTESEPVRADGPDVVRLERLLEVLAEGQSRIAAALTPLDEAALSQSVEVEGRQTTLGQRLFGLYFHDTYHTGQIDLLRQVAGVNDKVI